MPMRAVIINCSNNHSPNLTPQDKVCCRWTAMKRNWSDKTASWVPHPRLLRANTRSQPRQGSVFWKALKRIQNACILCSAYQKNPSKMWIWTRIKQPRSWDRRFRSMSNWSMLTMVSNLELRILSFFLRLWRNRLRRSSKWKKKMKMKRPKSNWKQQPKASSFKWRGESSRRMTVTM